MNNSVRSRLYLTRPSDGIGAAQQNTDDRILRPMKSNYSSAEDEMLIRWVDGVFVAAECDGGIFRTIENGKIEKVFLEGVDKAADQGRTLSEHKTASNYAPKAISKMPHAKGYSSRALERAMEQLFADGRIEMGTPFMRDNRHPARGIIRKI